MLSILDSDEDVAYVETLVHFVDTNKNPSFHIGVGQRNSSLSSVLRTY